MHGLVVALALTAALCMGLGIVIRQRATMTVPADAGMSTTMMATLARTPLWWAGTGVAIAGYGFHALALAHGSLLLVQPLLVSSLLFALPISAWLGQRRVTAGEWVWAVLLTVALAAFTLLTRTRVGHYRPPVPAWTLVAVVLLPAAAVCVALAARSSSRRRAVLLAVPVGLMFGTIAVLTKISLHRLTVGGLSAMLGAPAPYLVVLLAAVGTLLQQSAFHAGSLQVSVPTMLVSEPVVAVLLAVVVLGEGLRVTPLAAAGLAVAVIVMAAATVALGFTEGAYEAQLEASRHSTPSTTCRRPAP
ncbi:MAG TPA: DMT family transporter [Mycobacterium sp.]|nr:DMT family transporter [Mycobacterium sp.]